MGEPGAVRENMQVIGSDGGMVGRVLRLHGDHIHVEPIAPVPGAAEHLVPRRWVARIDEHVHLDREAALVRDTWLTAEPLDPPMAVPGQGAVEQDAPMADPIPAETATAVRRDEAPHGGGKSWIIWLIGAILLALVIVLGIRGLGYAGRDADYTDDAKGELSQSEREASGAAAADANSAGAAR